VLDAHWLYVPAALWFFAALLAAEIAVWGVRGLTVLVGAIAGIIAIAFVVERLS
jgi:hypothetical protein